MTTDQAGTDTVEDAGPKSLRDAVAERVDQLQSGYMKDRSTEVATLAQLRRGAGKLPADTPELWGLTVDLADCTYRATDEQAETAIHTAITLYALHQQSLRDIRMHQKAGSREENHQWRDVGWAVRELTYGSDNGEPARRRLIQAGKATSIESLAARLRALVQLLKNGRVPPSPSPLPVSSS